MAGSAGYNRMFPVSWTELHRDAQALAWRLADLGPFKGLRRHHPRWPRPGGHRGTRTEPSPDRHGLLLDLRPHGARRQGRVPGKARRAEQDKGGGWLIVDDLVDTGVTARAVRAMLPEAHFATVYAKPAGRPGRTATSPK